jgi:hypothetical protein
MAITNPSFEDSGFGVGQADGWVTSATSSLLSVAEFSEETARQAPTSESSVETKVIPAGFTDAGAKKFYVTITDTIHISHALSFNDIEEVGYGRESFEVNWWDLSKLSFDTADLDAFALDAETFEFNWACQWFVPMPIIPSYEVTVTEDVSTLTFDVAISESIEISDATYDNDQEILLAGVTQEFLNNLDAVPTQIAPFDVGISENVEDFEEEWNLPNNLNDQPILTDQPMMFGLASFVVSSVDAEGINFLIDAGINDLISLSWDSAGTRYPLDIVLTQGLYSATQMAAEIQTKVRAALDVDDGHATSAHFSADVVSNRIRLITSYPGISVGTAMMELIDPPSDSAWPLLGFVPGFKSRRAIESDVLTAASFDVITPEAVEDFEEEWRDCESSKSEFLEGYLSSAAFASRAVIISANDTEFSLVNGQTLTLKINGGSEQTITFDTDSFVNMEAATPIECTLVINSQGVGLIASVLDDGKISITSMMYGASSEVEITGGTANTAFGFTEDASVSGATNDFESFVYEWAQTID